jgi:hypothetical protein
LLRERRGLEAKQQVIEGLLWVRDKNGQRIQLRAQATQREFERRAGRQNIILKARQVGITTWVAARFFLDTITRPGCMTVQVAHDHSSAEAIFRIVHRFLENLPEALRTGALRTARSNVRQIVFPLLDSEYRVESAGDANAGRGLTIRNLHCSEVARWPRDASETLASLRAAVVPGGEIVLESTPSGAAGTFYQEWQQAESSGYVRHFFPWWWEATYRRPLEQELQLTEQEQGLVERWSLSHEQIAFRRELEAQFGRLAAQEFAEDAESCFLASGECVFDVAAIDRRLADCAPPLQTRDNERLAVWWPPQSGSDYTIGVDPAGGGSEGDYSCAQVVETKTGLQCAELYGHLPPRELAAAIARLGREYNHAMLAVERNNHGQAVLAHLVASEQYQNLYQQQGKLGWYTSAISRPSMLEQFAILLSEAPQLFSSMRLLRECRTFVRRADGSAGAASGAHDDAIMAMAIAAAVRKEASTVSRSGLRFLSLPIRHGLR